MDAVLDAARAGDEHAFAKLVARHRRELEVHCYRMLGSVEDAEDALQETLTAAWRAMARFEGRSSVRTWLYRIATNCCLRVGERRPPRMLSWDHGPARSPEDALGEPVLEPIWLDPLPTDPAERFERRETLGLAYVAALQHLPPNQRAVLILREVLAYTAEEVAGMLETSTASVNSALQRAKVSVRSRVTAEVSVGQEHRQLLEEFLAAFEASDVDRLADLVSADVRFTMPPLTAWYDGRDDVLGFLERRVFATRWRLVPVSANGQPAYACYQWTDSVFTLGAINVLSIVEGRIAWIAGFVDPIVTARFGQPKFLTVER